MKKSELVKFFEAAGVDPTKGKAKRLITEAAYDLDKKLQQPSRGPGPLTKEGGMGGVRVSTAEGEIELLITNVHVEIEQEQLDQMVSRLVPPEYQESLTEFPDEGEITFGDGDNQVPLYALSLKQYAQYLMLLVKMRTGEVPFTSNLATSQYAGVTAISLEALKKVGAEEIDWFG